MSALDVITIGRSSVDLYGAQVGGRLEDMASFRKYIGGSPTNIAAGTARLGLKSALITRVGDEHMGRFIREQLQREGVDTEAVITDPERLTALVLLGIRDEEQFPLIFYRENCADMALCEDDIEPAFIARAGCVTATGTHLSNPQTEAAVLKALKLARDNGARTALDIDYRPNLWGLAGHDAGEERFIESEAVTAKLQSTLHLFDLIVGTEEEFHIAGGSTDTMEALQAVRNVSDAVLVCKRGPMGAVAFTGALGESLDDGQSGPGFPIEVFNVLGAGDGFMSGLLCGWLKDEPWETSLTWANACGAFAVSRHGCAPAYPSWEELQWFLEHGSDQRALRFDEKLEHVHWATNRRVARTTLAALDLENDPKRFDELVANGSAIQSDGVVIDWLTSRDALYRAGDTPMWIGRHAQPGDTAFEHWPLTHTAMFRAEEGTVPDDLTASLRAARAHGLETLLHLTQPASQLAPLLEANLRPDWWMVAAEHWDEKFAERLESADPWSCGFLIHCNKDSVSDAQALLSEHAVIKGFVLKSTKTDFAILRATLATRASSGS